MRPFAPLVALLLAFAATPHAAAFPDDLPESGTRTCGGAALAVTDSTTGTRVRMVSRVDLAAAADFTGQLFTELRSDTGGFGTVCWFEAGVRDTCLDYGWGLPVTDLVLVQHVCGARDLAGDAGGSGSWSCSARDAF